MMLSEGDQQHLEIGHLSVRPLTIAKPVRPERRSASLIIKNLFHLKLRKDKQERI